MAKDLTHWGCDRPCMVDALWGGYLGDELDHGALNLRVVGELLVHVVDGDVERAALGLELLEWFAVQAIGFAHQATDAIAVHSVLMQRFGSPDQNLCCSFGREYMRTQRPDDVTLALGASSGDSEIAAQAHGFIEGATHVKQLKS